MARIYLLVALSFVLNLLAGFLPPLLIIQTVFAKTSGLPMPRWWMWGLAAGALLNAALHVRAWRRPSTRPHWLKIPPRIFVIGPVLIAIGLVAGIVIGVMGGRDDLARLRHDVDAICAHPPAGVTTDACEAPAHACVLEEMAWESSHHRRKYSDLGVCTADRIAGKPSTPP
jgi:hypothetical protein